MLRIFNFYFFIFFSIILSMRVNSGFLIWLRLELNMLRFLPIFSYKENIEIENSIKYFLVQRWASIIFLMRFFFSFIFINNFSLIIIFRIFVKLGVVPFHIWFISILKSRSLFILIFLSTVQKIIPLIILINLYINLNLYYINILLTIFFSVIIIPSMIRLNKILAVSSVNNIIWLIFRILISIKLIIIFILIYLFMLVGIYFIYNLYNINIFYQIVSINLFDKFFIVMLFISLGGMPPLLGFLRKYLILKILLLEEKVYIILIIIFSSLLILYYYLSRRYFYLTNLSSLKINYKFNKFYFLKLFYLVSIITFNFLFIFFF